MVEASEIIPADPFAGHGGSGRGGMIVDMVIIFIMFATSLLILSMIDDERNKK